MDDETKGMNELSTIRSAVNVNCNQTVDDFNFSVDKGIKKKDGASGPLGSRNSRASQYFFLRILLKN